jgi:hypothetical protein
MGVTELKGASNCWPGSESQPLPFSGFDCQEAFMTNNVKDRGEVEMKFLADQYFGERISDSHSVLTSMHMV